MKAKICGVTTLKDALVIAQNNAWAIGFNFYKKSLRYIEHRDASDIMRQLPCSLVKVGIFIEEASNVIIKGLEDLGLDIAQVYEDKDVPKIYKKRMILSLQVEREEGLPSPTVLKEYAYILLDAPRRKDGLMGGTGRQANWGLAKTLARNYQLILAGGLKAESVKEAIHEVHPFAVDVASGIEQVPGIKDHLLINQFLEACKDAR